MDAMDIEVVERARRGDREAFAILARSRGDRLFGIAHRMLRDVHRAEDAVQQTLVIAWRELPRLRDPGRFDAWLQRLLVRSCYAEMRQFRSYQMSIRVLGTEPADPDPTLRIADRDQLERGFRRLPPEHRAVLVLRHYLGLEPTEIAETLGIPVGTARSRLHYAHRAMRAALAAEERASVATRGISG
jgi:RNA polymerase sigma-70 factor (ECF subfamily)